MRLPVAPAATIPSCPWVNEAIERGSRLPSVSLESTLIATAWPWLVVAESSTATGAWLVEPPPPPPPPPVAVPWRTNPVGTAAPPPGEAVKPKEVDAPGAMVLFQLAPLMTYLLPTWLAIVPFQSDEIWPG